MKFWHVTVFAVANKQSKQLFQKRCLTVGEANTLYKEKKEEYPGPEFMVLRENF